VGKELLAPDSSLGKLKLALQDVAKGGNRTVSVGTQHGTSNIEIEIPLGINDGDNVQYAGIGPGGTDLIINYRIHPNPKWQRSGLTVVTEHTVSIWDCLAGCDAEVADLLGTQYTVNIPPLTPPGSLMRLKDKGLRNRQGKSGDLLIRVQAKMPSTISEELLTLIKAAQIK